jgi:hypothetical protein
MTNNPILNTASKFWLAKFKTYRYLTVNKFNNSNDIHKPCFLEPIWYLTIGGVRLCCIYYPSFISAVWKAGLSNTIQKLFP